QPDQSIYRQRGVSRLRHRRNVGYRGGARGVGHCQGLDLAGLDLRAGNRIGRLVELYAAGSEIVSRLDRIAVRNLFDIDADALEPTLEDDVEAAGEARPVELARLAPCQLDDVAERLDRQVRRHRDCDDGIGHARDRG